MRRSTRGAAPSDSKRGCRTDQGGGQRLSRPALPRFQGRRRPPLAQGHRARAKGCRAPPRSAGLQRQDRGSPGLLDGPVFRRLRQEGQGGTCPLLRSALRLVARRRRCRAHQPARHRSLRATANGSPLKPGQLDQAKVSGTDFRVESATIDTRQRLKVRKLFTTAGVACKPNEEAAAAGEFLSMLSELARRAGGETPLPEHPDTSHLLDLQSLAGNEQLVVSSLATMSSSRTSKTGPGRVTW